MSYSTLLCPALGAQYEYLQTLFRGGSLVLGLKGLQWTTGIFCWFNVTRLFFSPLIASANSCSFFFLSSIYLSAFFVLGLFMYNFTWFIKLMVSAGICGVCAGMPGCVQVCAFVRRCAQVCAGLMLSLCVGERPGIHGCVHDCSWVYSGLLLENIVLASADFDTYAIRLFYFLTRFISM